MPDVQIPAWVAPVLTVVLAIGGTIGWFVRKLFERRWAKKDRFLLRGEADLEKQLELLRDLNGNVYGQWVWLVSHRDAEEPVKAAPVADEIGKWFYLHSPYFPEEIRVTLVNLGWLTFFLATDDRWDALRARREWSVGAWKNLRGYQRKVEGRLGF